MFFDLNVDEFPQDIYDEIWVSATSPQMSEIKKIGKIVKEYKAEASYKYKVDEKYTSISLVGADD